MKSCCGGKGERTDNARAGKHSAQAPHAPIDIDALRMRKDAEPDGSGQRCVARVHYTCRQHPAMTVGRRKRKPRPRMLDRRH
jgi:hypothetical protein